MLNVHNIFSFSHYAEDIFHISLPSTTIANVTPIRKTSLEKINSAVSFLNLQNASKKVRVNWTGRASLFIFQLLILSLPVRLHQRFSYASLLVTVLFFALQLFALLFGTTLHKPSYQHIVLLIAGNSFQCSASGGARPGSIAT